MSRKRLKTAPFVGSSKLSTIKRAHKRLETPHYNYIVVFTQPNHNLQSCQQ